jgi:HAD superfamily phosphoserine phosphatase-like hydrolase
VIRLVALDLDGTLVRGDGANCGAVIAEAFGQPEWIERMEPLSMRGETAEQMRARVAPWLRYSKEELCRPLERATLAPGAEEAFRLLQERRVRTAIVSLAFDFIVEWFVRRLRADFWTASHLGPDGAVTPLWPEDKGPWLANLADRLGLDRSEVAAVGDSVRDARLLRAAGHPFYVGAELPRELADVPHHPGGDLAQIARVVLAI